MISQQNDASSQFAVAIQQYLDEKLPKAWIGRAHPIPLPLRLPDRTTYDNYSRRYLNNFVFQESSTTIEEPIKLKVGSKFKSLTKIH